MMKRLLILFAALSTMGTAVLAQSSESGYAIPGTAASKREAVTSSSVKQASPATVGELYPNPASSEASLSLNLNAPGKIVFYNLLGTPVSTQEFGKDQKQVTIDFSNFSDGVYFGIVTSNNKTIATRRISVKK